MGCLWLTLCDPDPPINGQFLYSEGLISSVARTGTKLTVLGLARSEGGPRRQVRDGADMILAEDRPLPRWRRLLTPVPMVASRCLVPDMKAALSSCLADSGWEAIVFDSIAAGWALPALRRHRARHGTRLVYLSHNVESAVARQLALAARGPLRVVKQIDAWKAERLERQLIRDCDLVTANTPEDCRTLEASAPRGKVVEFLPPGYGGAKIASRVIDPGLPRRAVAVGSFDWAPKRLSLEAFLTIGEPVLSRAGVELQIVGGAEASYLAQLRQRFPSVEFTGMVPDVRPYMANARLALVPDLIGGFKLKSLDYVFNRLPIFAMEGAVPGTPMVDGKSIRLFNTHRGLAEGVAAAIDDMAALNAQQEAAFMACSDRFDWDTIGRSLIEWIGAVSSPRKGAPSVAAGFAEPERLRVS